MRTLPSELQFSNNSTTEMNRVSNFLLKHFVTSDLLNAQLSSFNNMKDKAKISTCLALLACVEDVPVIKTERQAPVQPNIKMNPQNEGKKDFKDKFEVEWVPSMRCEGNSKMDDVHASASKYNKLQNGQISLGASL